MRLILIREPIITLLLLLSQMLTTASPPVCLSFNMTIYLCLPAWSQSLCQSACVLPPLSPLCESAACLLVCLAVSWTVLPVMKHGLLSVFFFSVSPCNKNCNYLFLASLTHTYRSCQKAPLQHSSLGMAAQNKWPWYNSQPPAEVCAPCFLSVRLYVFFFG